MNYFNTLLLWEDHPLFQLAIETAIITDPSKLTDKKNPFKIYFELQKGLPAPLVLKGLEQLKFKDLPKDVDKNSLKNLIQALKKRIESLSSEIQSKTLQEITSTGYSLEEIERNLLSINNLLLTTGKPEDQVDMTVFQLFVIVSDMLKADTKIKSPPYLSEQEDKLLLLGKHLLSCMTGKKDAIAKLYNLLEKPLDPKLPADEKLEQFTHNTVQKNYQEVLESDEFLEKSCNTSSVSQKSHQTLYLKNLLHVYVGFLHRLQFDRHTGVLYNALIDADIEELIKAFYSPCPSKNHKSP